LEGEKPIEMKYKEMTLGRYYPERNLIHLYFNPFKLSTPSVFDEDINSMWVNIFNLFTTCEVKVNDVSKIQEKLFVSEFMRNSRSKLEDVKSNQRSTENNINSYEERIRRDFESLHQFQEEQAFLQNLIDNKGKGLFAEVKAVETLPFITGVEIEGACIKMKFKETFMPIPDMMRNDHGKKYGKRFIWVGDITFEVTPDHFKLTGPININGHCHPHANGYPSGSPCFGDGDGRRKIYELLAASKFVDLAKMLWFWIKTYKNNGAYVKVWTSYDEVLKQGYPVLDEKGNRIEINDPERIKTGEQIKLTKHKNFADNEKKFSKRDMEA